MHACRTVFPWVGILVAFVTGCAQDHGGGAAASDGAAAVEGSRADAAVPALPSDEKAHVGGQAFALLTTLESAGLTEDSLIEADATFSETSTGVDLQVRMRRGCVPGPRYALLIKQGADCTLGSVRGADWDPPRGEDITTVSCDLAAGGSGRANYTRAKSHAKPWTIGTPKASNLLGHALVLTDPAGKPLACGVITRTPDLPAPTLTGASTKTDLRAMLAGICFAKKALVQDSTRKCPDPVELTNCSREHCKLDQCAEKCADFLSCLEPLADACEQEFECEMTQACSDCRNEVGLCAFQFCVEEISCAPPTQPDGPCAKLEACCAMQGDQAPACLENVRVLQKLSGDGSCAGVMMDWDTVAHLKVPCRFQ